MKTLKDGGPAFPVTTTNLRGMYGMTLRDYFAAAALQGMLADKSRGYPHHEYASDAYSFADAMMAERTKELESEA